MSIDYLNVMLCSGNLRLLSQIMNLTAQLTVSYLTPPKQQFALGWLQESTGRGDGVGVWERVSQILNN